MSLDFGLNIKIDTGGQELYSVDLFSGNCTHNMQPMWKKAGVLDALYESHGAMAGTIIVVLTQGEQHMREHKHEFLPLEPSNGWGTYAGAMDFLQNVLQACREHPNAIISISR